MLYIKLYYVESIALYIEGVKLLILSLLAGVAIAINAL